MTPPTAAVSGVKAWCLAMRPRTLPAAVGPVLVGTAAAAADASSTGASTSATPAAIIDPRRRTVRTAAASPAVQYFT